MEKETLMFQHLEEVLNRYGNELVEGYKMGLLRNNTNASGKLANSVRFEITHNDKEYEVLLGLEEYAKFVEKGRRAGKFPPIDKILNWIRIKPVLPKPYNGKVPTEKQLAYLIGRKIALEGTEPQNILKKTLDDVNDRFFQSIYQAVAEDVSNLGDDILHILAT